MAECNHYDGIKRISQQVNFVDQYARTRRYDSAVKYRIGPIFTTKEKLAQIDSSKPGKLKLDESAGKDDQLRTGLLTYLSAFMEHPELTELDLEFISTLLNYGVDIDEPDEIGQTALFAFVRDWHPDVVQFALQRHAALDIQDKFGRTPLHLAAALNYQDTTKVLLQYGANSNLETFGELQSPVHYAAKYNSIDVLRELIKYDGSLSHKDYIGRTPLFVAAEKGCDKTTNFLIEMGVPSGVYDIHGNSALAYLLEKVPSVGLNALGQYCEASKKLNRCEMYLSSLEVGVMGKIHTKTLARSPLHIIASYSDKFLIMHPVIQAAIDVKWKKFGRKDTIRKLIITMIYILCWMILSYKIDDTQFNYSAEDYWQKFGWKLLFEILVIMFALYFFMKDFILMRHGVRFHSRWMQWKLKQIRSQYVYCHPTWPIEREKLLNEEESIASIPNLAKIHMFWFICECVNLFILGVLILTQVLVAIYDRNRQIEAAHRVILQINMGCAFIRIIRIALRFRYFAVVLKVASSASTSFFQIVFLYLQFYIPFVAGFWLWFGVSPLLDMHKSHMTPSENSTISNHEVSGWDISDFLYHVYTMSFEQEEILAVETVYNVPAKILILLFHGFTTFIALSIIIAFITAKFSTNIKQCHAEASLLQSYVVLQLERNLNKEEKEELANFYLQFCSPLLVTEQTLSEELRGTNAESKTTLLQFRLSKVAEKVHSFEGMHKDIMKNNDIHNGRTVFNSVIGNSSQFNEHLRDCHEVITKDLRYFSERHEFIPKLLEKIFERREMESESDSDSSDENLPFTFS